MSENNTSEEEKQHRQRNSESGAAQRFVLDVGETVTEADRECVLQAGLDISHDLEKIGLLTVRGTKNAVEALGYEYTRMPNHQIHARDTRSNH